jgi:hypothetical protein
MAMSLSAGERRAARVLQCLCGLLQWAVLVAALAGPVWRPRATLLAFTPLVVVAALNATRTAVGGARTLRHLRAARPDDPARVYHEAVAEARGTPAAVLQWEHVVHAVIIPNYAEPPALLAATVAAVAAQPEAGQTVLVLAMEDAEAGAAAKGHALAAPVRTRFRDVLVTVHPAHRPGEVPGKAANAAWAARALWRWVTEEARLAPERVVVTVADADALLPPTYLACLTADYATTPARTRCFWQAHLSFLRNVDAVPALTRGVEMLLSADHLGWLANPERRVPLSTYALSLTLLHDVGYWDPDALDEDIHVYTKAVFHCAAPVCVRPLYVPVHLTALQAHNWHATVLERFRQAYRHALGARTVGYILARHLRGGPLRVRLLGQVLLLHVILPTTLLVTAVGLPWWHACNDAATWRRADPLVAAALGLLQAGALVMALAFAATVAHYATLKGLYLHRRLSLADVAALALLPIAGVVYMYLPILAAQTTLFFRRTVPYHVAPKPASVPAPIAPAVMV